MYGALTTIFAFASASSSVLAQDSPTGTPLTDRRYQYPNGVPYKVDTDGSGRGPQFGYTKCNSTTEGDNSDCQLAILNDITDFCLWGPPDPNSLIGNEEAETVAFCTKKGHGARIMPQGTITGVQVLKAPDYILFAGTINQVNVNIDKDDYGGEMDPHGADERGNPLGGLVYTNGFPSNGGNANSYQQVIEWHNFMGSNIFCFKVCDPSVSTSKQYCNNVFDRTGCSFVAPASYQEGVFEVCDSANQDPVGVYTSNGQVLTYKQPPEGVEITSLPNVKTPASSNCKTYASSSIYTDGAAVSQPSSSSSGASSGTSSGTMTTGTSSVNTASSIRNSLSSLASSILPTTNAAVPGRIVPLSFGADGVVAGAMGALVVGASVLAGFVGLLATL